MLPSPAIGPKENTKSSTSTSKKAFSTPPSSDKHGNGSESVKIPGPLGVPSPFLIDFLIQYITSACHMLDKDDSAMLNPLLSVNLIQLISVLLKWEHFSEYRAKTVNYLMNSLLRCVRNAVTKQRRKMLDSSPYLHTTVGADVEVDLIGVGSSVVGPVTEPTPIILAATAALTTTATDIDSSVCGGKTPDDVMKDSAAAAAHQANPSLLIPLPIPPSSIQPSHSIDHRPRGKEISKGSAEVIEIEIDGKVKEIEKENEKEKQKKEEEANYSFELLIELACIIALFSSRSASILIKGNPHSMVRTYAHPYVHTDINNEEHEHSMCLLSSTPYFDIK